MGANYGVKHTMNINENLGGNKFEVFYFEAGN